ncbi:MAG: hypothetical protein RJB42_1374 [Bacteroidota bacterium]
MPSLLKTKLMNLSSAIDYLTHDPAYIRRQLSPTMREALELVLEVLQQNVNVEEWDNSYYEHGAMCQHCSGNGCGMCRGTGEPKRKKKYD